MLVEVLLSQSTFVAVPQTKCSFSRDGSLPNAHSERGYTNSCNMAHNSTFLFSLLRKKRLCCLWENLNSKARKEQDGNSAGAELTWVSLLGLVWHLGCSALEGELSKKEWRWAGEEMSFVLLCMDIWVFWCVTSPPITYDKCYFSFYTNFERMNFEISTFSAKLYF